MMKNNKLKSFTLMSVLIGMVLSSLLMSFVYYIYSNMNQVTHQYSNTHLGLNNFILAKTDIKREIEASQEILAYPNGFSVLNNDKMINYYLSQNQLIKNRNNQEIILFEDVKSINVTYSLVSPEIISSITILFLLENQEFPVYIYNSVDVNYQLNTSLINE